MVLDRGNYFRRTLTLTADVVVNGGNFILCDIVDRGAFTLTVNGGNVRGLKFQGAQLDPASLPAWITRNGGAWSGPGYIWRRYEPLAKAKQIVTAAENHIGSQGVAAWNWAVVAIVANPAITYANLLSAWTTYANGNDPNLPGAPVNGIDLDRAFRRVQQLAFGGNTFAQIKTEMLSYPNPTATWAGDPTEIAEEYS